MKKRFFNIGTFVICFLAAFSVTAVAALAGLAIQDIIETATGRGGSWMSITAFLAVFILVAVGLIIPVTLGVMKCLGHFQDRLFPEEPEK